MRIQKAIEEILGTLFDSFFHGMPDFGEGQEPDRYAVYTLQHKPENYVSGRKTSNAFYCMLTVFTPSNGGELYDSIEEAFTSAGFLYQGGREIDFGLEYPQKYQYSMDFVGYEDAEGSTGGMGGGTIPGKNSLDYSELYNKPQIEGITLLGNKKMKELGIDALSNLEIKEIINKL